MKVGEKIVLCYDNGNTETISLPEFGNIVITIQNGKIYKVEKSETQIRKNK